ncbi:MAG: FtsX-like permease family protein [Bacteroidota bacterium]
MSEVKLAFRNFMFRKFSSFVSVVLLAFGVAMVSLLLNASKFLDDTLTNSVSGVDMVIGAKGSPMQLILANVYHVDNPTGNIPLKQADALLRNPLIGQHAKLSYGDYYKQYRILGVSPGFKDFYDPGIAKGKDFQGKMEVVLGSRVASETGLMPGDHFASAHGEGHGEKHAKEYTVSGILKPSGTVVDGLILTATESVWEVHGHQEAEDQQITAVLVKFRSPMGLLTVPAMINKNTTLMAAVPAIEVNRLLSIFGEGIDLLYYLAVAIVLISLISVLFSLINSLKERKYELALLRLQGASRWILFRLVCLEAAFTAFFGALIGIACGRLVFAALVSGYSNGLKVTGAVLGHDLWLIPAAVAIALVAALIPAITASRTAITTLLKDKQS